MGSIFSKRVRADRKPPQKDICSTIKSTKPTKGEIESHALKRVESILNNEDSKNLLREFLQKGHRSDKSNATILLERYEWCERILSDLGRNQMYLTDLIEVCTYKWEEKINEACETDNPDEINQQLNEVLNDLKKDCVREMQCDNDFTRFRRDLVEKYKK